MAKIAIIVPPLTGHLNPTLGIGAGLIERGHEVSWIAVDHDNIGKRLPEGAKFLQISYELNEENAEALNQVKTNLEGGKVYGIESIKCLYEQALTPFNNYMLGKIKDILDENPMDLIIVDQHMIAGAVAAVLKGIPYVTSVSTPASILTNDILPQISRMETEHILAFQQNAGISGEIRLDLSQLMCLVYTSKLFSDSYEVPEHFKYIGPVVRQNRDKIDFDWDRFHQVSDRTKVLVSVGTTFGPEANRQFFTKVAEALGDEDMTVVAVSEVDNFEYIPDNFIVQKRVPQLELLPYMDLVICHGGYNTVSETLLNAKPLVVLPKVYDQSYISSRIMDRGVGVRLNFNRFKPQHLKDAVHQVLSDNSYVKNAEKIKQSFIEAGGIAKGVELLEGIVITPLNLP